MECGHRGTGQRGADSRWPPACGQLRCANTHEPCLGAQLVQQASCARCAHPMCFPHTASCAGHSKAQECCSSNACKHRPTPSRENQPCACLLTLTPCNCVTDPAAQGRHQGACVQAPCFRVLPVPHLLPCSSGCGCSHGGRPGGRQGHGTEVLRTGQCRPSVAAYGPGHAVAAG